MTTTIQKLTGEGWKPIGTISASGGKLTCEPADNETLKRICETPIMDNDANTIGPDDAEAFVRGLSFQYASAYLMATDATEE